MIFFIGVLLLMIGSLKVSYILSKKFSFTKWKNHFVVGVCLFFTLAYWAWEMYIKSSGYDIRIDLIIIYPFLFCIYAITFWPSFKWKSLGMATLGIVINILFFILFV